MAKDCFIQNYFDHDPGPGYFDYHCGTLTYDGHTGTDFRVKDIPAMKNGVPVIAAAPGVVVGMRDGEPDIAIKKRGVENLHGKDAGNGAVIDHGDGWVTQYSHLQQGSVRVKEGQRVQQGEVLGFIGESGNADFSHVDFTVRHEGKPVDGSGCGGSVHSLWSAEALSELRYQSTGLLVAGFAPEVPTVDLVESGKYASSTISAMSDSLAFYAEIFGAQRGDHWFIEIRDPDNQQWSTGDGQLIDNKAMFFAVTGKRRGISPWKSGSYIATFKLDRASKALIDERQTLVIR